MNKKPTKKEAEVLIEWAEKEIKEYEDFIRDLKLLIKKVADKN